MVAPDVRIELDLERMSLVLSHQLLQHNFHQKSRHSWGAFFFIGGRLFLIVLQQKSLLDLGLVCVEVLFGDCIEHKSALLNRTAYTLVWIQTPLELLRPLAYGDSRFSACSERQGEQLSSPERVIVVDGPYITDRQPCQTKLRFMAGSR